MTQQLHKPVGIIGGKCIMPRDELLLGPPNIHNFKYGILGPPSPPYSAPIVLTAVQVYICHHQMAVNEIAQHQTKIVD